MTKSVISLDSTVTDASKFRAIRASKRQSKEHLRDLNQNERDVDQNGRGKKHERKKTGSLEIPPPKQEQLHHQAAGLRKSRYQAFLAAQHLDIKHKSRQNLADKHPTEPEIRPLAVQHLDIKHKSHQNLADKHLTEPEIRPLAVQHFDIKHKSRQNLADRHLTEAPEIQPPRPSRYQKLGSKYPIPTDGHHQRQKTLEPPPPTHINMYIHDKFAPKYSANQLDIALNRSFCLGDHTVRIFWLVFLIAAVILDYLKSDTYLLRASTYEIVDALDIGIISGPRNGKFGWPILLVVLTLIAATFHEFLSSRSHITVATTSYILIFLELIVVFICLDKKVSSVDTINAFDSKNHSRINLFFVVAVSITFFVEQAISMTMLTSYVRGMEGEGFPQETTLVSKRRQTTDMATPK